jgi:hypothetical protein
MNNPSKSSRKNQKRRQKRQGFSQPSGTVAKGVPRKDYLLHHVSGVPQHTRETLVWVYGQNFTPAANAYTEMTAILLNSPYDPDTALGGTSATGFVKWMQFYSKCFAVAARIKIKFAIAGTGFLGDASCINTVGLTLTTNSTSLGGPIPAIATGLCDYKVFNKNPDSHTFDMAVNVGTFLDKPNVLDDPQLFCTSAANPGQIIVAHFWVANPTVATGTEIVAYFEVEYDCIFTDPIPFT